MQTSTASGIDVYRFENDGFYMVRLGDTHTVRPMPDIAHLSDLLVNEPLRALDLVTQIHAGMRSEAQKQVHRDTFKRLQKEGKPCPVHSYRTFPKSGWFLTLAEGTVHICPTPECLERLLNEAQGREQQARNDVSDAKYVLMELEILPVVHIQETLDVMKPAA